MEKITEELKICSQEIHDFGNEVVEVYYVAIEGTKGSKSSWASAELFKKAEENMQKVSESFEKYLSKSKDARKILIKYQQLNFFEKITIFIKLLKLEKRVKKIRILTADRYKKIVDFYKDCKKELEKDPECGLDKSILQLTLA